jgi:DNA-binding HxlR family transcriptional regulator
MRSGFGQFCPVAVACEVFAERWTPMILRELFAGSDHFNQIHRGVPLMSRALLARRLRGLEDAGVIAKQRTPGKRGHRYTLTPAGQEFRPVIEALGRWGQRWTVRVQRCNLDAGFLMWNVRRRIDRDRLPEHRIVVCFRFSGIPRASRGARVFWLMLERTKVELCIEDPGVEIDVMVDADLAAMTLIWLGDLSFEEAVRSKGVRVTGPRRLASAFPAWLMLSGYADVPRPGAAADRAGTHSVDSVVQSAAQVSRAAQPRQPTA